MLQARITLSYEEFGGKDTNDGISILIYSFRFNN